MRSIINSADFFRLTLTVRRQAHDLPIAAAIILMMFGCRSPSTETIRVDVPTDYSVFAGGLHITKHSKDKPEVWVFSPYAPLQERVKAICGFDTKTGIEGSQTMCLVVIKHRDGSLTEQTVTNTPIDLRRYIDKMRHPVSELVADLYRCLD